MSLDGIAAVEARIAEIEQRFAAPLTTPSPATSPRTAAPGPGTDFPGLLATETDMGSARAGRFVADAVRENGKSYVWGATASPADANPPAFDCSELTRWAAERVGLHIPDGAAAQYLSLKEHGTLMPVEQALRTPGALLFSFDREPRFYGDVPDHAHVAISLGNGRTIEARGRDYGVGIFDAKGRFQYAGMIPDMA